MEREGLLSEGTEVKPRGTEVEHESLRNADGAVQTRCAEGNICCCWPTGLPPAAVAIKAMTAIAATEELVCQCVYGH